MEGNTPVSLDVVIDEVATLEAQLKTIAQKRAKTFETLQSAARKQSSAQAKTCLTTMARLDQEAKAVKDALSKKRTLTSATGPYRKALEDVRAKRQKLAAAQAELDAAEAASSKMAATVQRELERINGGPSA